MTGKIEESPLAVIDPFEHIESVSVISKNN